MKAAVLHEHGAPPVFGDFEDPEPRDGHAVVEVAAAAVHHLDLHKATGTFYMGPPPLPSVVGSDGVGHTPDGRRAYFDASASPFGSMAQRTLVPEDALFEVAEGIGDAQAAALGNTGLGAWLALTWRSGLQPGETVIVLGATGAVGGIAVQAAKLLGAGRVVAAARSNERLPRLLERGADAIVDLDDTEDLEQALREATQGGVDVTIDALWGEPARAAMAVANRYCRHIQVGQIAGLEIPLRAPDVRSVSLDVRGFSVAHPPPDVKRAGYLELTTAVARGDLVVDLEELPLAEVATAWERQGKAGGGPKLVLTP